ncbi:MAG: hypothetical protein ABI389_11400 [Rhodanobacter sp.]
MTRFTERQYRLHATLAGVAYMVAITLVWPLLRTTDNPWFKVLLVLVPLLSMFYVIGLLGRKIWHSDELQQRMHLVALGVSSAAIATVSLAGGFLTLAKVVSLDGTVLIGVFPVMVSCYLVTHWWVARRYGVSTVCDDVDGMPMYQRFLLIALAMAGVALFAHARHNDEGEGMAAGMGVAFVLAGLLSGLRRWWSRHLERHGKAG